MPTSIRFLSWIGYSIKYMQLLVHTNMHLARTVLYLFLHWFLSDTSIACDSDFETGKEEEELRTESDRDSVGLSELPGQEESKVNTTLEGDSRDARESRRRVEHTTLKHFNASTKDVWIYHWLQDSTHYFNT